jgi:hypothetical protein
MRTLNFQGMVPDSGDGMCQVAEGTSSGAVNCRQPAVATVTDAIRSYRVCRFHADQMERTGGSHIVTRDGTEALDLGVLAKFMLDLPEGHVIKIWDKIGRVTNLSPDVTVYHGIIEHGETFQIGGNAPISRGEFIRLVEQWKARRP